jgi:PLD-like domain
MPERALAQGSRNALSYQRRGAQELIDDLAARNNSAAALAAIVSIASRIEPELLRSARLAMLATADASAEADLWLSPLMRSRGALFAVMRTDVARILRERLRAEPARLNAAWQILTAVHRDAPPALQVEEEITWRALVRPDDPQIERLFSSVAAALDRGRVGLARWATRALPDLPAPARDSSGAWSVRVKASALLTGYVISDLADLQTADRSPASSPRTARPTIKIGLRLFDDSLRLSEPPEPNSKVISLPRTNPLLLEVAWEQAGKAERRVVSFLPNSSEVVRPIGTAALRVTTATLDSFLLQPTGARQPATSQIATIAKNDILVTCAYRGDRAVLLGFDIEQESEKGLLGFAIERADVSGPSGWLQNWLSFGRSKQGPTPSNKAPFQRFRWIDALSGPARDILQYRVCAVYGTSDALTIGRELIIKVDLSTRPGEIEVGFTRPATLNRPVEQDTDQELRPSPSSSEAPGLFDTGPYQERYRTLGATAYEIMSAFIGECVEDIHSTVHVFAYDIDHPDIIRQFIALGQRLTIVLDDSPVHEKSLKSIETPLRHAGCDVKRLHFKRYSHNKIIVRLIDGKPAAVLTGSANFSILSLFAQSHFVFAIRNEAVAAAYEKYFQDALLGREIADQRTHVVARGIHVLFMPTQRRALVEVLIGAIAQAKSSILFSLGEAAAPEILEVIRAQKSRGILVEGVLHGKETLVFWEREERQRKQSGRSSPNFDGSFVVIDFNGPGASVFAGSSRFATSAIQADGDNVLWIQDSEVATRFAIQAFQTIDHFRFRTIALQGRARPFELLPDDRWIGRYRRPGTIHFQERRLLVGDAGFDRKSAPEPEVDEPRRKVKRSRTAKTKKAKARPIAAKSVKKAAPKTKSSSARSPKRKLK